MDNLIWKLVYHIRAPGKSSWRWFVPVRLGAFLMRRAALKGCAASERQGHDIVSLRRWSETADWHSIAALHRRANILKPE